MACQDDLSLMQGMLVAVPNPNPGDTKEIQDAIDLAIQETLMHGIAGPQTTPYILKRVNELTKGNSLDANISLVMNNTLVASMIAKEYAPLAALNRKSTSIAKPSSSDSISQSNTNESVAANKRSSNKIETAAYSSITPDHKAAPDTNVTKIDNTPSSRNKPLVVVFGGAVVDQMMIPKKDSVTDVANPLIMKSSNPGTIYTSFGGVGRNIAEGIARLKYARTVLVSAVGSDSHGASLVENAKAAGIDTSYLVTSKDNDSKTAVYAAVHDNTGDLVVAIADMDIFHKEITPSVVAQHSSLIKDAEIVVSDGNLSVEGFAALANMCKLHETPLFFEPTSDVKCVVPILAQSLHKVPIAHYILY
jgi:pseudouridine-5'-phosphate glycosidase/pseudouridine kinase